MGGWWEAAALLLPHGGQRGRSRKRGREGETERHGEQAKAKGEEKMKRDKKRSGRRIRFSLLVSLLFYYFSWGVGGSVGQIQYYYFITIGGGVGGLV